ncbi:MAG: hypothetical protein ACFB0C_10755 [Leptolyngbyaceae cyanobacterium]|mgnify:CR=1 FL=1
MVFDPQKGNEAIAPDEPVRWFVTTEAAFLREADEAIVKLALIVDVFFDDLQAAIDNARQHSQDEALYVWPFGQPLGERQAIAVAIGGELYLHRDAQPTAVPLPERRTLATIILAGMLSSNMLQEWDVAELASQSIEHTNALIAALEEASN